MAVGEIDELDDLVGEWANAASDDLEDLDALADAWADKKVNINETQSIISDPMNLPTIPEARNLPPPITGPVKWPTKPKPVLLPPLPTGDFAEAAKRGDDRYASPIEVTPKPIPVPITPVPDSIPQPQPPVARSSTIAKEASQAASLRPAASATSATAAAASTSMSPQFRSQQQPSYVPEKRLIKDEPTQRALLARNKTTPHRIVHSRVDDERRGWLPYALLAGAGVAVIAFMGIAGQGSVDTDKPTRVIDQPVSATEKINPPAQQPEIDNSATLPRIDPRPLPTRPSREAAIEATPEIVPTLEDVSENIDIALKPAEPIEVTSLPELQPEPMAPAEPVLEAKAPNAPPSLKPKTINAKISAARTVTQPTRSVTRTTNTTSRTVTSAPRRLTPSTTTRSGSTRSTTRRITSTPRHTPSNAGQLITAGELLLKSAYGGSSPSESASQRFNASLSRALNNGNTGDVVPLQTPDGKLLAMKVLDSRDNQLRTISIPRAREVSQLKTELELLSGLVQTASRTGLRATPLEGPATKSLEKGTQLLLIGQTTNKQWILVGAGDRAIGFLKRSELQAATGTAGRLYTSATTSDVQVDVVRVRTECRDVQYAIDGGGASGAFTACRAYGGEWVIERGGDTPALSADRF